MIIAILLFALGLLLIAVAIGSRILFAVAIAAALIAELAAYGQRRSRYRT